MIRSKTELALQQLSEEMHAIIKSESENDTCYFPNIGMLLQSFDNYLQCLNLNIDCCNFDIQTKRLAGNALPVLFKEEITVQQLLVHGRFLKLLFGWELAFSHQLRQLFTSSLIQHHNQAEKLLSHISLTEVILLMYLGLEVERKEIAGRRIDEHDGRDLFVLKEIVKILGQVGEGQRDCRQRKVSRQFSINSDKFVKILLLKSLKLKLQRSNFSFGPAHQVKHDNPHQTCQHQSPHWFQNNSTPHTSLSGNQMQQNFSLISIQSEYNESIIAEGQLEGVKENVTMLPLKLNQSEFALEMSNLSSDDIFQYISLNELHKYISR